MVAADSKAKFLHDAERYVLHGKVQQAIGEYLKIVRFDPNDVLILNTIGDLYLRQGNRTEANRYFSQVAETYVRNNFFLKAIAVYKKILSADPNNLEINGTMASLYAKQGLSVDARNQYLRVAGLLEKEGRARESLEFYDKVVELDPSKSAVQRKLAQMYHLEGAADKARIHWAGAARALAKAGNSAEAIDCYGRALELDPLDAGVMRGFLDCCIKSGNVAPAIERLTRLLEDAPENVDLREMLGQAYLASNVPDQAVKAFQTVVSIDETRYENLLQTAEYLIDRGEFDKAVASLDSITPILITHRETERAAQLYELILQHSPGHVLSMVKLASIYSATGERARYLEMLDRIADHHLGDKKWIEAIEYLEKILKTNPESEKHKKLHRQAYSEAYPDVPYVSPADQPESNSAPNIPEAAEPEKEGSSSIVEIDLLMNYGMREKALSLLLNLETCDPTDKEVRMRLLSIYRAEKKNTEAAEQCLLLAALCRNSRNEEAAQNYLAEAEQLDPDLVELERDLEAFARRHGIEMDGPAEAAGQVAAPESEVDLSSDLIDIFFSGEAEALEGDDPVAAEAQELIPESYGQEMPSAPPVKPMQEQLQEVDFYIRLGFRDEALAKLNEIARTCPNDPQLQSRFEKLGEGGPSYAEAPVAAAIVDEQETENAVEADGFEIFSDEEIKSTLDQLVDTTTSEGGEPTGFEFPQEELAKAAQILEDFQEPVLEAPAPSGNGAAGFATNEMFADLMAEVGALDEKEATKDSFEDHFSLGTAYREMELIEEAIREFQLALKAADLTKDARKVIQCCGMLSTCYLKKGMPASALRWCQTGLNVQDISSHEALALRYDMGVAHSMSGSSERALECFDEIFGLDPSYRDVAQRIDELKARGVAGSQFPVPS